MFSGKTDELIRRLRRARIARQKVQVFFPALDARYAGVDYGKLTSHAGAEFDATPARAAEEIPRAAEDDTSVVAIDEAQFFDDDLVPAVGRLVASGLRVIVAGLDTDFRGEPFGPMPLLMAEADRLDKLQAICLVNGKPARFHDPVVVMGAGELYEARCRAHHTVPRE
jgi:thymidine kinase